MLVTPFSLSHSTTHCRRGLPPTLTSPLGRSLVIGNSLIPSRPERTTAVRTLFCRLRNEILGSSLGRLTIRILYCAWNECGVRLGTNPLVWPRMVFRGEYFDFILSGIYSHSSKRVRHVSQSTIPSSSDEQ